MARIRVTKRFHFEMAHALHGYDGLCRNIHGHSYNLEITIIGEAVQNHNSPKDGMVMDFHDLKTLVKEHITGIFDHALMINSRIPSDQLTALEQTTARIILVGFQPTTENILSHIAGILTPLLPDGVNLFSIRLYETVTSFAEWFASDNQ
jgi:6-pyruvoyltetrahydropterin/6-carboxytetrahydropterin synthase